MFSGSEDIWHKLPDFGKEREELSKLDRGLMSHIRIFLLVFYRRSIVLWLMERQEYLLLSNWHMRTLMHATCPFRKEIMGTSPSVLILGLDTGVCVSAYHLTTFGRIGMHQHHVWLFV